MNAPQPGWDAFNAKLSGIPLVEEVNAMSRSWDAMADAFFDLTTDRYEQAKARFLAGEARLSKEIER